MARWSFGPNTNQPWGGGSLGNMGANLLHGLTTGMDLTHAMNQYDRENNTLGWGIASQNAHDRASTFDELNAANGSLLSNQEIRSTHPWLAGIPEQYGSGFYSHPGSTVGLHDDYGPDPYAGQQMGGMNGGVPAYGAAPPSAPSMSPVSPLSIGEILRRLNNGQW